ncbi:MAG: SPOR domain-containing protein [Candidatus Auribacterota bacterium]|nr:SPOR domain-containing protein [Candidatus Auribacterota bacterium]
MSNFRHLHFIIIALIVVAVVAIIFFRSDEVEEKKADLTSSEPREKAPSVEPEDRGLTGGGVEIVKEEEIVEKAPASLEPEITGAESTLEIIEKSPEVVREPAKVVPEEPVVVQEPEEKVPEEPEVPQEPEKTVPEESEVVQEPAEIVPEEREVAQESGEIVKGEPEVVQESGEIVQEKPEVSDYIYNIQMASFHYPVRAELLVKRLKSEGYRAFIPPSDLKKQGSWYRVFVGEFNTRAEADSQLTELRKKLKDSFIRQRRKQAE